MAFKIKGSHILAIALAGGLGWWMATGDVSIGGNSDSGDTAAPIAEREADENASLFKVRHLPLQASTRPEIILIRGRTQADAVITVRAETIGVLERRLVSKGQKVKAGDLVCVLEHGAREAQLAQAKAQLVQAETEYKANAALKKKGFASANQLTSLQAAVDVAKAAVAANELELNRTQIRANASGVVQDPVAEVGDMLTLGGTCITLVDKDPMLFTGQVSERDINKITVGMKATISLITGETAEGKLRYVAPSADPQTRTFAVEIEIEQSEGLRDGMTAEAMLSLPAGEAFRILPSWVSLDDNGIIGVRIVNAENIVEFVPIKIVAQEKPGFWITGPKDGDRIITLGQEFVVPGETVETSLDERVAEQLAGLKNEAGTEANQ